MAIDNHECTGECCAPANAPQTNAPQYIDGRAVGQNYQNAAYHAVPRTLRGRRVYRTRIGARNTAEPLFFRLVVDSRASCVAFPTSEAKNYYLSCLRGVLNAFPVEVVAYSVIHSRAYFVIASYDQAPVSYRRCFEAANAAYSQYFNKFFQGAGFVFKSKLRVKRIKDNAEIADSIALVEAQPYANLLCNQWAYPFSSYSEYSRTALANRRPFFEVAGEAQARQLLAAEYAQGPRILPADFVSMPEIDRVNTTIDNVLIDYGYMDRQQVPNDIMHRIIAEVNERGNFSFDEIARAMTIKHGDYYEMGVKVVVELTINMKQKYDESIKNLKLNSSKEFMRDVFVMILNLTGYSAETIFGMMGFAYAEMRGKGVVYFNDKFLKELVLYISDMKGISVEKAIERLGIVNTYQDPNRVLYVARLCRNEL